MADFRKRNRPDSSSQPEDKREAEARTREHFGIQTLSCEEELIDESTFSDMHARMEMSRGAVEAESAGDGEDLADELLLEEIVTELPAASRPTGAAPAALTPPSSPAEVAALELQIAEAGSRDEVVRLSLRIALLHCRAAGLFVVGRGMISGLCGAGEGLVDRIEGVMIPAASESLFARPLVAGKPFRGSLSQSPVDRRVLRALGRAEASEVVLLPIRIGDRVVSLLYADNGADPLPDTGVAALRTLTAGMARAYERLIRERKKSQTEGAGG